MDLVQVRDLMEVEVQMVDLVRDLPHPLGGSYIHPALTSYLLLLSIRQLLFLVQIPSSLLSLRASLHKITKRIHMVNQLSVTTAANPLDNRSLNLTVKPRTERARHL